MEGWLSAGHQDVAFLGWVGGWVSEEEAWLWGRRSGSGERMGY